jgi:hypothetical protein
LLWPTQLKSTIAEGPEEMFMWRKLSLALTIAGVTALCCAGGLSAAEMRVTLLGTGTPTPRLGSFSASTLVEAGSERLIFDLGRGSTIRLFQKLSGDTRPDARVSKAAEGADLLIHEVAVIEPELPKSYPSYRAIEDHHTLPEDAGRIFTSAKPKLAVYSHIVFATLKPVQDVPEDALIARTQTTYKGPLIVGRDLMSFVISDKVEAFAANGDVVPPLMLPRNQPV